MDLTEEYLLRNRILQLIGLERISQDEKWGEQNHPVHLTDYSHRIYQDYAVSQKEKNDRNPGSTNWSWILLEEVYEALAETEPGKQIEELIQVSAVAVNMIESILRKQRRSESSGEISVGSSTAFGGIQAQLW